LIEGATGSYGTLAQWPLLVYFQQNHSSAYLGVPPVPQAAVVCATVTVDGALTAEACRSVELVDLVDEQASN
jgi:hypothetical protein